MEDTTAKKQLKQHKEAQKLNIPIMTEGWMHVYNAVLANKLALTLPLDTGYWQCTIHNTSVLPKQWQCLLHISVGGHMCDCYLENLAPFATAPLNTDDFPFLPKELLHIIIQNLVQNTLQSMAEVLNYPCELHDFTFFDLEYEPDYTNPQGLLFALENTEKDSSPTRAYITNIAIPLYKIFLDCVENTAPFEQEYSLPIALAQARINLNVAWQAKHLHVQDIQELAVGDCLLLPPNNEQIAITLCVPHTKFKAKAQLNFFTKEIILESYMQDNPYEQEEIPQNATNEENESTYANPLHCPIPVQCHLGSVSLSIEDISKLSPGMVLGPMESLDAPVHICVGNACIGRGSLVDIEGRIGVQISEIFKK